MTPTAQKGDARTARLALAGIGFVICVLALPLVLVFDGPIAGWVIGTALWTLNWLVMTWIGRVAAQLDSPVHSVGLAGISSMGRAFMIFLLLMIVGLKIGSAVALTAGGVFLAAFTFDLIGRTATFQFAKAEKREEETPS